MGEVAVHGHQSRIPAVVGPRDPLEVSAANALFARAMDHRDPSVGLRQTVEHFASAIRRIVVNEQKLPARIQREDEFADLLDVLAFIVGRDENQRGVHDCALWSLVRRGTWSSQHYFLTADGADYVDENPRDPRHPRLKNVEEFFAELYAFKPCV